MHLTNEQGRARLSAESPNLDLMRGVAVLLVLSDHILETWGETRGVSFHPLDWQFGRIGVLLFFVHTALVLSGSLDRDPAEPRIRRFYIRRIARIYPLCMFVVAVAVLFRIPAAPWGVYEALDAPAIVANVLLVTDVFNTSVALAPLWTLPIEIQIYVLLPLVYLFIARGENPVSRALTILACSLVIAIAQALLDTRFITVGYVPCFAAGVLTYALMKTAKREVPALAWPLLLVAVIAGYLCISSLVLHAVHSYPLQWAFCLAVAVSIPYIREARRSWWTTLWHLVAKYSYGIYLFHCMALFLLVRYSLNRNFILFAFLAVAITALASVLAYHLIEQPMIRVGAKVANAIRSPARASLVLQQK
jgi:peptidoglycan/LPS O-acetylase OafA/YrhL